MKVELTNLLPRRRVRALKRGYFFRLLTVAAVMLTAIIVINITLLVPSYLFLQSDINTSRVNLQTLDMALAASQGSEIGARIARVEVDAEYLTRLEKQPTASAAIRSVLGRARPGITLTGINFTAPTKGDDGKMLVSGTAATRDALRRYNLELSSLPFVKSADLPISAYAKDSDIPFTITLTGTLLP
jgi:hypothetical protein